jgi:hypothetical protein
MGQSYRIRTELGVNKTINVQLDQDFEFLEILSLKIQQSDIYTRSCADYGVIVGRITANNGFGIPNARVSIFVPIRDVDQSNPVISSIYPYKSPLDKNEDGYRYNLLPYEKSYSAHAATGTLPTRNDTLTGSTAVEIYDTYYKYSTKTNESGDYMIMGAPLGSQTLVMDVDLSDIGEFSLTPQDLIRMGLASEGQVAGNRFKTSTDLNSLPQIISLTKQLDVSPLWGDPDICQIAVNRVDFDLRDDANVDIQPTSVFMGSIYSTSDSFRLRKNARPRDNMGNLCSLTTGPGQILAIRQTIQEDRDGNPILEQYQLEQSGNIIDGNGVWMTELPMNLDYFITNEFGEKVLSNDPTVGIPTKGRYRFKVKWSQSTSVSEQTRRPNFLIPNVKEYGWGNNNITSTAQTESSYYFGLDWSGYTKGFNTVQEKTEILNSKINCEDTFYEFNFNRVYTVSSFIDQFKNGGRGRFIGIKEIDDQECEDSVNKFPVNDGFRNFDLLFFLFSIILFVLQTILPGLLIAYHFIAFIWNNFAVPLVAYILYELGRQVVAEISLVAGAIAGSASFGATAGLIFGHSLLAALYAAAIIFILLKFKQIVSYKFGRIKLPMITYPDCQACECISESTEPKPDDNTEDSVPTSSLLTQLSNSAQYSDNLFTDNYSVGGKTWLTNNQITQDNEQYDTYVQMESSMQGQALTGKLSTKRNPLIYKSTTSTVFEFPEPARRTRVTDGQVLPPAERINVYNTRKKYFDGINKIKVNFAYPNNGDSFFHYDNTLTILSSLDLEPGTLMTFVNPFLSKDKNYLWTGTTLNGGYPLYGINGKLRTDAFTVNVSYANTQTTSSSVPYNIPSGSTDCVDSVTFKVTSPGTITYKTCPGSQYIISVVDNGITPDNPFYTAVTSPDCINVSQLGGTAEYTVDSVGEGCQRYQFPSDIEYYQVLTAITITKTIVNGQPQYSIPDYNQNGPSFWKTLNDENEIITFDKFGNTYEPVVYPSYLRCVDVGLNCVNSPNNASYSIPTSKYLDFETQKVLILQRGVDPYSPLIVNKYGIGKILGYPNESDVTFTATTRMNTPIQALPPNNGISVQKHNNQNNLFYSSYFFTPGIVGQTGPGFDYSAYTTPNVGFYGALDSSASTVSAVSTTWTSTNYVQSIPVNGLTGVASKITNRLYSLTIADNLYDGSEDLSGGAIMNKGKYEVFFQYNPNRFTMPSSLYFSPILYPQFTGTSEVNMSDSTKIIMRTDRLPSSDYIDNENNLNGSVSLLQQNPGFAVYILSDNGFASTAPSNSLGASQVTPDIGGLPNSENVLTSLSTCENMVGLDCYQTNYGPNGYDNTFGIKGDCQSNDSVENGCYVMVNKPLLDLFKDMGTLAEWGYRFKFFYGLCRGVLSQSFMNNWVNGSLYMFPIQVDIYYNKNNQPSSPVFANEVVYFNRDSNNFYYRSSPYNISSGKFVGRPVDGLSSPVNRRNLLFPTTIINLGIKDDFYQEILFDPSAKGYIMKDLNPTSYSDTSDLVNLFVISRITDEGFLQQIIPSKDNSLNQLFSRNGFQRRIDGDLAQAMSINSEFGVIPFSPEFYQVTGSNTDPVRIVGPENSPTMAIFFSSSTIDLQNKDFLSPGVIDFRPSNNANAITYKYGIKSQEVPYYQWEIKDKPESGVFGTEKNNWLTNTSDIFSRNYQSLDRRDIITPSYLIPSSYPISDTFARGYIFNVTGTSYNDFNYSLNGGNFERKILVGAPNHFYFGVIKGETALDKFKTKYSIDE